MQTLNKNFYWHNPNFTQEYVDYLHDVDEDLVFRLYVNPNKLMPSSVLNLNQSLQYHFMTTTTYDTMYEPNLSDFLHINGFDWHIINIDNPIIHSLLGVKYYAVTNKDELPNTDFKYVATLDHYSIYRNPNFSGMGFTYDEYIPLSKVDHSTDWLNQLILIDKDYERYNDIASSERAYLKITEKGNNYFIADIDISHETILFVSIPYNKGWSVVDNYDNNHEIMNVQGGFMGLYLQPGNYQLNFNFIPYGFKIGVILSALGVIILILTSKNIYKNKINNNEKIDN
jgi:uncharacterized membrane protein YfhO